MENHRIILNPLSTPPTALTATGVHKLLGIGPGFLPPVLKPELLDEILPVDDDDAAQTLR